MASRPRALFPFAFLLAIAVGCTLTPRDRTQALLPDQFHFYYETLESDVDNRGSPGRGFDQEGDSFLFGLSWDLALPPAPGITREDLRSLLLEMRGLPAQGQADAGTGPAAIAQLSPESPLPVQAISGQVPARGPIRPPVPGAAAHAAPPEPPLVSGTVLDGRSGEPLSGALVLAPDGSETRSGDGGRFELRGLQPGLAGELVGTTEGGLQGRIRLRPLAAGRLEVVLRLYPR
jgi:hypothetical protein